jgi:4-diphosphocytidyl-2-C-methyl-D-erythritol kinase
MDELGGARLPRRSRAVAVRVPAKVNLQLAVGPRRDDGYHDLCTVFQAVSLYDEVLATPAEPGSGIRITVSGDDVAGVPAGPDNLAVRAAGLLADQFDIAPDVHLHVSKGIPVAGGMAGGSADAAAALVACDHLWGTSAPRSELAGLAAQLGSDVPFLLSGGTAIGTGRGERLTSVLVRGSFTWVVATSHEGLSTPAVYQRFDEMAADRQIPEPAADEAVMAALRSGDAAALGAALSNDLQPAALSLRPGLQPVLDTGRAAGALGALVSGSGPTVAFLVADEAAGMALTLALAPTGLCRALRRAHGPVPGAHVVAHPG